VIFFLAQRGIVCWGPPAGTQQALVLVDDWIPTHALPPREQSLADFTLRYFTGHGPATERDFAWWTKLTLADIRAAMAACGDHLTELTHRGVSYWIGTEALDAASRRAPASGVRALPGFDEYLLGYQDRSLALPDEHAQRIVPGNNGIFLPTITSAGRIVGTWRRAPGSRQQEIVPEHFAEASAAERAGFARAARGYARFMSS
jgi:hypothetical protein